MVKNFKYGTQFIYKEKLYVVIGEDIERSEIECQTLPFDKNFYWFKVLDVNKVRLI